MAFELVHTLVSETFRPLRTAKAGSVFFTVNLDGGFPVAFIGKLNRAATATYQDKVPVEPIPGEPKPLHGLFETATKFIPITLRVFTPDGQEFNGIEITLADLRKFRDQRGVLKQWSYTLIGQSEPVTANDPTFNNANGSINLSLTETIQSESAPPLIAGAALSGARSSFQFDLFRVGMLVAEISQIPVGSQWRGSMRLLDPDGLAIVTTQQPKLTFNIDQRALNRSRDAAGGVRKWTLEVSPQGGVLAGSPHISATVIGSGRITVSTLLNRIKALLGTRGEFIKVVGEDKNGQALGRLMVTDVVSAETIDMFGLLEGALKANPQDFGSDPTNFEANKVFTFATQSESVGHGVKFEVGTLKVGTIDVAIGPGVRLGAAVPTITLTVAVSGAVKVKFEGLELATAKVRNGKFDMEVGIQLSAQGTPQIVTAVPPKALDVEFATAVKLALEATVGLAGLIAGFSAEQFVEDAVNKIISKAAQNLFSDPKLAPQILMTIFGAHLTYLPFRFDGADILFNHIAPVEPEFKPTPGYHGAIGRSLGFLTSGVSFSPLFLGDTWSADNLKSKVKHIVVVMMENRSYDHVLGYRSQAPINDGADGLTSGMITAIQQATGGPFAVSNLHDALFPDNSAHLKTRLPHAVGHELSDVAQQLSVRTAGPPEKGTINSPRGFVDNFKLKLNGSNGGVELKNVLGFYDQRDLAFYDFLATNYAYCDRFFCSHPGPTLPNRMYSLTGDLQHDRYGIPILDSNNGDNFLLSRAPTIYDLLSRKGLSFRVYESDPSVTMLRMFARYATDDTNIVSIDQLQADVAPGGRGLPDFTAIEPRMHSHPEDDDHPDADMLRGQHFIKRVYDTLSSNQELWRNTLLIITYDEHGGFYDHVVPPNADVYESTSKPVVLPTSGGAVTNATSSSSSKLLVVPYGVRVPTFVVSPWTMRGKGPSVVLDHCSILKTVLARFLGSEKPFLSDRVNSSHSFESFLSEAEPRMNVPASPTLPPLLLEERKKSPSPTTRIITRPLSRKQIRAGGADYHDLSGRWARQLGR